MKAKDLRKIFPIQQIEQECLIAGNGDVSCGWELCLPEVFSLDAGRYNDLYDKFLAMILKLPSSTVVHFQNIYYHGNYNRRQEVMSFSLRENDKVFLGRPMLYHTCRMFVTFTNKTLGQITSEHHPVVKLWDYLGRRPFKDYEKTVDDALYYRELLTSFLTGIEGIVAKRLDDESLTNALWDFWNVSFASPSGYSVGKSLPPYSAGKGILQVGGNYVGLVSMVNQGGLVGHIKKHRAVPSADEEFRIELGCVFPITLGLSFNHIVNSVITLQDRERMYMEFFRRSLSEGILSGFGYEPSVKKAEAIRGFREAASGRDLTLCSAAVNVIVAAHTSEELQQNLRQTLSAFDGINDCHSWIENEELLSLFVGSSPGFGRGNYRRFDTVVNHALCYVPMETQYISDLSGNVFTDRFGNPVVVDLWDSPHLQNRNMVVEGGSGTGKSFWVNGLVDEDLERGTHVVILDVGHSYRDLCTFNKGLYFDSANREQLSFNIFLTDKDAEGLWVAGAEKRLFIHSVLLAMWQGTREVTAEVHVILKDLVDKFYEHVNSQRIFPVFDEFYRFIDIYEQKHFKESRARFLDFESLRTVFESYATGEYHYLLNSTEQVQLKDELLVVFDIEHIENDRVVFPVVGLIIMELVMEKIRSLKSSRKRFIIDEGWKVLRGELRDFVEYLYRTFRKHEGSILLATQDINDFSQVACADAMLSNSDTLVLMRRAARKNYDDLQRWLSLTDFEISLMQDMKKREDFREFFIKQGDHARVFRYEVSKKTQAVYSSRGSEKAEIQRHFEKHGNLKLAVNQYLEDRRKV